MPLVAGVDSSTQSCKVVVRDAGSGRLLRHGSAPHPGGTEVDPEAWWTALLAALDEAGGLEDVAALSVAGQQHGMVCLDDDGAVVRPALLWNDTRSADAAADLVRELGDGDRAAGATAWAAAVGTVPVASITVTKLRWLADHEPDHAARTRAIALPHDWLTWKLAQVADPRALTTDRSDASGTGYFDAAEGRYRRDLLALALRRPEDEVAGLLLPRVAGPAEPVGRFRPGQGNEVLLGPGCGDNAGAALGLDLAPGEACLSIGTSGVVSVVADRRTADASGLVSGFADATGHHLPLACTLNGAPVLDATARLLGVGHEELDRLALAADPGAGGLVHVPYLDGERTPNLPDATGSLHGMTQANTTRENLARCAVEGLLCLLAGGLAALTDLGVPVRQVTLVGGAARSEAVRRLAPAVLGLPVDVPEPGQSVADGAARQAAWVLSGEARPPEWQLQPSTQYEADPQPDLLARYREFAAGVGQID